MADTKQGRDKKARDEANAAEQRVLKADLAAFRDGTPASELYGDVDPEAVEIEDPELDDAVLDAYLARDED